MHMIKEQRMNAFTHTHATPSTPCRSFTSVRLPTLRCGARACPRRAMKPAACARTSRSSWSRACTQASCRCGWRCGRATGCCCYAQRTT
eukprot:119460-Chlamydomonas_euryale.AAC.1